MDLTSFRALLTPTGQRALEQAGQLQPAEADYLRHYTALARSWPPELAQAALETAILRREAAAKFPFPEQMFFTRPALEQATAYEISKYRSEHFDSFDRLADLGCSIGADTISLASLAPTLAVDLDPLRLEMARANLAALGLGQRALFLCGDLAQALPIYPDANLAIFFDPARRSGHRRAYSVRHYQPSLAAIRPWLESFPALGVKISPGVELSELAAYDAEIEFISLHGELKEAVLWFGPLKRARRSATLLPGPYRLAHGGLQAQPDLPISPPLSYIYEPDPAILRAGLVQTLGVQLNAAQLDPDIAYLTSDTLSSNPFARAWPVETWFPFQLKRLRQELRQRGVGQVTIKKRGSPLQPEALIHALRLSGSQQQVIFLTHLVGKPIVILASGSVG
jgi:hypothetical protein